MKDFVEFLKTHKIISTLKNHYRKNSNSIEIGEFIDNFDFKQLLSVKSYDNKNRAYNLDEFAAIYEQNISYAERKKLGEIYSPQFIVDKILDETGFYDTNCDGNKSIIDISCGAGSFLVQAVRRIVNFKFKKTGFKNLNELGLNYLKDIIKQLKSVVFGVDINPIACILCQINILCTLFSIIKQILMIDSEFQIPIFHIYNRNIFSTKVDHKYDYVIGNPPYLFIREISEEQKLIIEKGEFETAQGQYDYYQLFIEIGIKMLNSDGILGFIIPDSILALSNRHIIRKYIYDHTLIKEILYLGPQFEDPVVSNLIIILQEERDPRKREKNIIGIKINWNSDVISNSILQSYIKGWNYKFLISLNQEDIKILNFLNKNVPKLNHIMESSNYDIYITRGVELTKEGKVIYCRECNKYYPLPRGKLVCKICNNNLLPQSIETIIVDQKPQNQNLSYAPFIYSINRYNTKQFKYIILGKPGIDYKSPGIYKDRVIIRQLAQNNLVCATYSKNGYTSQSFYNLGIRKSPIPEFNIFFLLGLINSELISFYFIKSFGSYKNLYPRILIEKVKDLPIKVPQTEYEKIIATKVSESVIRIMGAMEKEPNLGDKYQLEINKLIYQLYKIKDEEKNYINSFLNLI
jgi:hypothetical protein